MMGAAFSDFSLAIIVAASAVMGLAGFVKGSVGFALPMVAVSGIGALLPAPVAVTAILLPAILTNLWQALRDGPRAAWESLMDYRRYTLLIVIVMGLVAPLVSILPPAVLLTILGGGVSFFAMLQYLGWHPSPAMARHPLAEWISGGLAGVFGGLAAVTGPAVVLYLLARDVPKAEQMRVQGIIFFLGLVVLLAVHGSTGVLTTGTFTLSALLVMPGLLGMAAGLWVHDRLDQALFRRMTLLVLIVAGLNLLRRGLGL